MSRFQLTTQKALILSFSVCAISIWLSIRNQNWIWFSRSGSIIVIIGIVLTSSHIIENSGKLHARRRNYDNNFGRDYADETKQGTLKYSRRHDEDIWESSLRGLYLLIAGTLIWGYGDLISLFLT